MSVSQADKAKVPCLHEARRLSDRTSLGCRLGAVLAGWISGARHSSGAKAGGWASATAR